MIIRRTILLLSMLPLISIATTKTQLLTEIRNSLTLPPSTVGSPPPPGPPSYWNYSSTLSGLGSNLSSPTNMTEYWTGEAKFKSTTNRIQFIQIVHDTLLAFPHIPFSTSDPTETELKATFSKIYSHVFNQNATLTDQQTAFSTMQRIKTQSAAYEAYFSLYVLTQRSQSCLDYWQSKLTGAKINAIIARDSYSGTIPETPDDCQKIYCTTDSIRPYNGFFEIGQLAARTRSALRSVNCSDTSIRTGIHSAGKQKICTLVEQMVATNQSINAAPTSSTSSDLPLTTGKRYIEGLLKDSTDILQALQTIVALQIDEEIHDPGLTIESISSIYQAPKSTASRCSAYSLSNNPTPGMQDCNNSLTYQPRESVTLYISRLLGLEGFKSVIEPSMPLGLPNNYILIAGKYQRFNRIGLTNLYKSLDAQQLRLAPSNRFALFMDTEETSNIHNFRTKTLRQFFDVRNKRQSNSISFLLGKAASLDLINDIRKQNEKIISFQETTNQYRSKQLTLLSTSASWRLHPTNESWIHSIASESNVSLLREIAILLAEIRNIQFHRYAILQKSMLMDSIIIAKSYDKLSAGNSEFVDMLQSDITSIVSGGAIGLPPNAAAQKKANDGAVSVVRDALPPAP